MDVFSVGGPKAMTTTAISMGMKVSLWARRLLVCALVLSMAAPAVWVAGAAHAQESFDDLVARGLKAYSDGQYDEAVEIFMKARVMDDQPDLLYNIARCYHKKGDCIAAQEHYKRFVSRPNATPELVEKTKGWVAELGECATTGTLALACTPGDATVSIDGDAQTGPCGKFDGLKPGEHSLLVTAPGFKAQAMTVRVEVGRVTTATANLERAEAGATAPVVEDGANWLGWSLTGAGAALLIAGMSVDIANLSNQDELKTLDVGSAERAPVEDAYERNRAIIWALYGVGAAAAVTGVVFLITGVGKPSSEARAQGADGFSWQLVPSLSPDHAGGLLQLTF
jgi:tetratricopeptide (TPR) repeat protein